MRHLCLTFILVFLGQWINGQEMIQLWGEDAIGSELELAEPESKTRDDVTRMSNVTNPRIQVFKPSSELDNGNAIVICPGGGYSILAIDKEGWEIATWLSELGYTAYVLEYRVPDQREGAFQDVQRALRIARSRIADDKHVGVLGFSAGGHLTASAATRYKEESYSPIDEKDKFTARPDFAVLIYPAYLDKGENGSLSPEITLSEATPPFFIFMTADDPYVQSSHVIADALNKNKTSVEFHLLPEGKHGYGMRSGRAAKTWPVLCAEWLKIQNP